MGVISILYWAVKALLTFYWASRFHELGMRDYFGIQGFMFMVRAVGSAFLIVLFLKMKTEVILSQNREVRLNHFLVPSIMVGSLSVFVGSAIDQYLGEIDTRIA